METALAVTARTRNALVHLQIHGLIAAILLLGLLASRVLAQSNENPVPVDGVGLFLGPSSDGRCAFVGKAR